MIVRGDGEHACLELLQELDQEAPRLETIAGLSYRSQGHIVHNEDRQPLRNLDKLPLPAWHKLPMSEYRLPVLPPRWGNYSLVVTARGCPFQCSFCSPILGQNPYRALSAQRVLEMLDDLYHNHSVRVFWFSDLSFNVDTNRTEEILDGIISRGWKVRIALDGTRTDLIVRDHHLVPKMKKAGVFLACLGVETSSEQELVAYRKGTTLQKAEEAVQLLKRHGIHTWCFFMTGLPTHDQQDIESILDYAKKLDPLIAIFTVVMPVPGTPYHDELASRGLIADTDWRRYDMGHPVIDMEHLSREKFLDLYERCFDEFYGRPSKIIRHGILGDEFARYTYRFLRFVNSARQIKEGLI
jgi:radical SAM superfamily enzyme YgiQ (UPF0313 family)